MKRKASLSVVLIGCGAVGTSLGFLLARKGYRIAALFSRNRKKALAAKDFIGQGKVLSSPASAAKLGDVVLLTTPDDAIRKVAEEVAQAGGAKKGTLFLHCSGNFPSTILSSLSKRGATIASLHPLKSFADPREAVRTMRGTFCCFEGDAGALPAVKKMILDLGGRPLAVEREGKVLYHAGASVVSNFSVAILGAGIDLLTRGGVGKEEAFTALLSLLKGTVKNLEEIGLPAALTGPIARGDATVVSAHLKELSRKAPRLLPLYRVLGLETLLVARRKGSLSLGNEKKLRRILGKGLSFQPEGESL